MVGLLEEEQTTPAIVPMSLKGGPALDATLIENPQEVPRHYWMGQEEGLVVVDFHCVAEDLLDGVMFEIANSVALEIHQPQEER